MLHFPELPDVGRLVDDGGDPGVLGEGLLVHHQDVAVPESDPGHGPGAESKSSITDLN